MNGPGEVIRRARLAAGLSQTELAKRVGLKQSSLSHIERGVNRPPLETTARIADAVGADRATFLAEVAGAVEAANA